jgi:hypothetical protein
MCDSTASDNTTFITSPLETNFIVYEELRTLPSNPTKYQWTKILTKLLLSTLRKLKNEVLRRRFGNEIDEIKAG